MSAFKAMVTDTPQGKPCVCNICGKQGFCMYEDKVMAFCPTFIRQRIDVKKPLASSPFKCLSKLHISTRR